MLTNQEKQHIQLVWEGMGAILENKNEAKVSRAIAPMVIKIDINFAFQNGRRCFTGISWITSNAFIVALRAPEDTQIVAIKLTENNPLFVGDWLISWVKSPSRFQVEGGITSW